MDKIKKDGRGRAYRTYGEQRDVYRNLVRKPEEKRERQR
jgi:hypothetical protein